MAGGFLVLRAGKTEFNNQSAIVRKIREQVNPQLRRFADKVGRNGTQIMTATVNSEFNTHRPAKRRRYPGSLRLGSGEMFDYTVIPYRSGDVATQFKIKGGGSSDVKFMVLNFGSNGEHRIAPSKKKRLAYPIGDGATVINTAKGAPTDGIHFSGPEGVMWKPGGKSRGTHFYEKSIMKARRTTRP